MTVSYFYFGPYVSITCRRDQEEERLILAPIRTILDIFVKNCQQCYNNSEFTTTDEMLHPFRGHCSFIQYMLNKPAKYGVKIFALCDAKTFYCSNLEIYCGKQPPGPYDARKTPTDIVKRLVSPIENSNKNVTTDNWYTNIPLLHYLLEKKTTLLGTMKKNKREIPPEFLPFVSSTARNRLSVQIVLM